MAPGRAGGILRGKARGSGNVRDGKASDRGVRQGRATPATAPVQSSNAQLSNRAQLRPSQGSYQPPGARKPTARGASNSENGTRRSPENAGSSAAATAVDGSISLQQRYELLRKRREQERKKAMADGFLADPDNPRTLAEAITPVGTCEDMCAEFERVERIIQNDVWKQEVNPNSSINGSTRAVDEKRMVKKFRRAAAGIDEQLPSDLRPPKVLHRTVDYLFNDLLGDVDSLRDAHHFIWDRTRAIRNDFSIQQLRKPSDLRIAIECYERIARFHILCLHQFALPENRYDSYVPFQEREQLDRTLLSLMQYYDDCRGRIQCPNEAEFRAYCIIFQIQDRIPDLEDRVQTWPKEVVQDTRVQTALDVYAAACNTRDLQGPLKPLSSHPLAQENWGKFWQLVGSQKLSYLMSCVAELYFGLVRRTALNSVWQAYRRGSSNKTEEWSLAELVEAFGFDDEDQVNDFCEAFGFSVLESANGTRYLDLSSVSGKELPDSPSNIDKQIWSFRLVEAKRHNRTLSAIINDMSVHAARKAGLIEESEKDGNDAQKQPNDFLFVTGHSEEEDAAQVEEKPKAKPSKEKTEPKLNPFAVNFTPTGSTAPSAGFTAPPTTEKTAHVLGRFGQHVPSDSLFNHVRNEVDSQPSTINSPLPPEHAIATTKSLVSGQQARPAQQQAIAGNTSPDSVGFFNASQRNSSKTSPFAWQQTTLPNQFATPINTPNHASNSTFPAQPSTSPFQRPVTHEPSQSSIFHFGTTIPTGTSSSVQARTDSDSVVANETSPESDFSKFTFSANNAVRTLAQPSSSLDLQPPSTFNALTFQTSRNIRPNSFKFPTDQSLLAPTQAATQAPVTTSTLSNHVVVSQPSTTLPSSDTALFTFGTPENKDSGEGIAKVHGNPRRSSETTIPSSASTPGSSEKRFLKTPIVQASAPPIHDNAAKQSNVMQSLAQNMVLESYGFLEQFVEFIVGPIIHESLQQYESETMQQQADEFRQYVLAHRWSERWRDICWNRRLKRQGRERRQRLARDMQAKSRSRRESSTESQLQSFLSSLDSATQSPPVRNESTRDGVKLRPDENNLPSAPRVDQSTVHQRTGSLQQPTSGPIVLPRPSAAKRQRYLTTQTPSQGPSYRISKPYSSVLSGRSSFLGSSFLAGDSLLRQSVLGAAGQVDTTRSSYFKLKAMGLEPGGAISKETSRKRARDEEEDGAESAPPRKPAFSPPEKKLYGPGTNLVNGVSPTETKSSQTATNEEDEALFAQMRVARQAMSESISFFKEEIAKEEASGKSTSEAGASESPRDSQRPRNPPAYWNRVSKFVPREMYGKGGAKAKGKEIESQPNGIGTRPAQHQHAARAWQSFSQQAPAGFLGSFIASPPTPPAQEQPKGGTSAEDAIEL